MALWRVVRIWEVEAEDALEAFERAVPGQYSEVHADPIPESALPGWMFNDGEEPPKRRRGLFRRHPQ